MLRLYLQMSESIRKFAGDASGVTAIEYVLIASGIALAIITAVALLGDELSALFSDLQTSLSNM